VSDRLHPEDEALLTALGALAREREAGADAAWPSDDEALRPLDEREAAAMLDAVLGAAPAATPRAPARPRRRGRVWAGLAGVAAAAAAVLVLTTRGDPPALPDYRLAASAGEQTLRSAPAREGRARYATGSRVHLVASPADAVGGAIAVRVYVRHAGETRRLDVPVEVSPSGAVRLDAVAGETLPLPEGDGALVLLVRPAGLDAGDAALLDAADPRPARRLVHEFHFTK
jgi:hypothetical protein